MSDLLGGDKKGKGVTTDYPDLGEGFCTVWSNASWLMVTIESPYGQTDMTGGQT